MSQIVFYFPYGTSVLAFHINLVLALSIIFTRIACRQFSNEWSEFQNAIRSFRKYTELGQRQSNGGLTVEMMS